MKIFDKMFRLLCLSGLTVKWPIEWKKAELFTEDESIEQRFSFNSESMRKDVISAALEHTTETTGDGRLAHACKRISVDINSLYWCVTALNGVCTQIYVNLVQIDYNKL